MAGGTLSTVNAAAAAAAACASLARPTTLSLFPLLPVMNLYSALLFRPFFRARTHTHTDTHPQTLETEEVGMYPQFHTPANSIFDRRTCPVDPVFAVQPFTPPQPRQQRDIEDDGCCKQTT